VRVSKEEIHWELSELFPDGKFEMFPPVEAFDDPEYELRQPSAWLSASPTLGQYLAANGDGTPIVRPCSLTAYDADVGVYKGTDADNGMPISVPRVLLLFDGEDVALFKARLASALSRRDEALKHLQYQLCVRDMPTSKGDVVLPLDKIDPLRHRSVAHLQRTSRRRWRESGHP
jgi:hypothetical protein